MISKLNDFEKGKYNIVDLVKELWIAFTTSRKRSTEIWISDFFNSVNRALCIMIVNPLKNGTLLVQLE